MTAEAAPLITRIIELETPTARCPATKRSPTAAADRRGMIVIQEAFGVNNHIQEIARRLARRATTPWLLPSSIEREQPDHPLRPLRRSREATSLALTDDGILQDADAVRHHLQAAQLDDGCTGVIGFCMGGRASFPSVRPDGGWPPRSASTGAGILRARSEKMPDAHRRDPGPRDTWLGLFGTSTKPSRSMTSRSCARRSPRERPSLDIVRYPDAGPGSTVISGPRTTSRPHVTPGAVRSRWFDAHLP